MLWYSIAPAAVGAVIAFIALFVAHARGVHFAGVHKRDYPLYFRLVPVALAVIAMLLASASIDFWTVMRFFGSRGLAAPAEAWQDHVFSHALPFTCSICPSIQTCSDSCLWLQFFPRCSSGSRPVAGSCSNASATA